MGPNKPPHPVLVRISDRSIPPGLQLGDKARRLAWLRRAGFNVPDGVFLPVEFLRELAEAMGLTVELTVLETKADTGGESLEARVAALFRSKPIPLDVRAALDDAVQSLQGYRPDSVFAVRSAALGEDNEAASFAGQYSTELNVAPAKLWEAIGACFASWWTARAIDYRKNKGMDAALPQLSIVVQLQVKPDHAGVLFTRNPVTGAETVMVESIAGLGEDLVSGRASPARWEVDPRTGQIVEFRPSAGGPAHAVEDRLVLELVKTGKKIEKEFGDAVDVEWAIQDGRCYYLQVRPITTLAGQASPPPSTTNLFSRAIIEDLWSDRMTDITSSIVFEEQSDLYTFKTTLGRLSLHELRQMTAIKVFHGYAFLSAEAVARLLEYLPPMLRFREIAQVFPGEVRDRVMRTPFQWRKALALLPRLPFAFSDPAILPFLTKPLLRRHLRRVEAELDRIPVTAYAQRELPFYREELERLIQLLASLQIRNQWGYGNATIMVWLFFHYATRHARKSVEWVLEALRDIPGNVTMEMQQDLARLHQAMDGELAEAIAGVSPHDNDWSRLADRFREHPAIGLIAQFIQKYRFRSANRDFIHPRWDECPGQVLEFLKIRHKEAPSAHSALSPEKMGKKWRSHFQPLHQPVLTLLAQYARSFLGLREDLRFGLDKVFYRMRRLLLALNEHPHFAPIRAVDQGLFFLRLPELRAMLQGEPAGDPLANGVRERRQKYFQEQNFSPPFYARLENGALVPLGETSNDGLILRGIAASAGVATGVARVIRGAGDFHKLSQGDILVAYNTDPGWTPLFAQAAGVVVEMGGILNHCAIVAREYRIPAVVGISGVTQKIQDGQPLRIDGNQGLVEILEKP